MSIMIWVQYMQRKQWVWLILSGVMLLFACSSGNEMTVEVTQVVVEGEEEVSTRIIREIVTVTPLPSSGGAGDEPASEPVSLDISFVRREPPIIDPQKANTPEGIELVENLFAGLTHYNHRTNRVEPELAKSWEVSANGRVWTFHLRNDLFWVRPQSRQPNGLWNVQAVSPVTAEDVVYAIQRVCARETGTPDAVILFIIEGCEQLYSLSDPSPSDLESIGARTIDETTLEIRLVKPAAHFLTISSLWIMRPVPKFIVEESENDWTNSNNLVTSGPYVPVPERQTLVWNLLWPLPREGNVDLVNISYMGNVSNAIQLWEAKAIDAIPFLPELGADDRSRLGDKLDLVSGQTVFYLAFNFDSSVFREPEMRLAFSAAIDREVLVETLYGGRAVGMRHLTPEGILGAPPVDEVGMGYDPDFARIQMSESGFNSCRLMPPIRLLVTSSDLSLQLAETVQQMWIDELGCSEEQIVIEQAQFGRLLANTRRDAGAVRPDIWELGWASYYPDAHNWFGDLLHCLDSENRQNRACSEVDDLIRRAANTVDMEERIAIYREIENMYFGRDGVMPLIPLYAPGRYQLVQSWVSHTPAHFGGERYDTYQVDATLKRLERSR